MMNFTKKRIVSLVLVAAMLLGSIPADTFRLFSWATDGSTDSTSTGSTESYADATNPFKHAMSIVGTDSTSNSFRIPSMVTLADGTIVAAADIRWNTTYDGGGLDTLVAYSKDGGASWDYSLANYLGDNGNTYNGSASTSFVDPCLTVGADGQTVYMLCLMYPYGVALNGQKIDGVDQNTVPSTDTGFDSNGRLLLRAENTDYVYYLDGDKICRSSDGTEVEGYTVDGYFNITYTVDGVEKTSNLFFQDSPFKVVRTSYLRLTKSTDGGASWSEPTLLNLKDGVEKACLVAPGRGITTSKGIMVFPVYSFHGDNTAASNTQRMSFIYSTDGVNWKRSAEFNYNWASESAPVELSSGNLRFFFRNGTKNLCYVDYDIMTGSWGSVAQMTDIYTNSNTQISAITYSRTSDGNQVILVSCPSGPSTGNGTNSSSGSERLNGRIFVFTVDSEGAMTLANTIKVNDSDSQFMYSCLTERRDGSVAILFENKENAWGTGADCYYTMDMSTYWPCEVMVQGATAFYGTAYFINDTATLYDVLQSASKQYDVSDLPSSVTINGCYTDESGKEWFWISSGMPDDEYRLVQKSDISFQYQDEQILPNAYAAYIFLMDATTLEAYEKIFDSLSDEIITALEADADRWSSLQTHNYLLVYDHFYSTSTEDEFNAIAEEYAEAYAYIQADSELKYYNDLILERIRYVAEHPEAAGIQLGESVFVDLPSYTNVAPRLSTTAVPAVYSRSSLLRTAAYDLRSASTFSTADNGVELSKNVTYNAATGQYTVRLEAYTTGSKVTIVTQEEMPADIILVLDLSNSMTGHMDTVEYQAVTSGTAEAIYQSYGADEALFVKVGDEYHAVTVTGTNPSTTKPKVYSGSYKAKDLYEYIHDNDGILYYYVDGEYYQVSVTQTGNWNRKYTFSYRKDDDTINIASPYKEDANLTSHTFYTGPEITTYDSYTYSYTDASGQTVSNTYAPTDSIVGGSNPAYYSQKTVENGTTRAQALKDAVTNFAAQVETKAKGDNGVLGGGDDIAHAIAIVGYSGATQTNKGVYIGSTIYTFSDGVSKTNYQNALQNMSTQSGIDNITASIDALENMQGTHTYTGTEMAKQILAAQPDSRYVDSTTGKTIRSKVVVVFTDGAPNVHENQSSTTDPDLFTTGNYHKYNSPIADAYAIKNTYGATVYTVGILDDGNVTIPPTTNLNKYMHYMSSNYQNAQSMTNPGALTNTDYETKGGYYLLASSADDLKNIFSSIESSATSGGSSTSLSETTQIRDIITPYFMLPEGATTSHIELSTADYVGASTWGNATAFTTGTVTISQDGKTIGVTGFDYAENWVGTEVAGSSTTYRGKKLIIEFPIVVEPLFLGGSDVDTNGSTSGIYESADAETAIEHFDVPQVDVPLKEIDTVAQNKYIYLGNTVDLTGILNLHVTATDSNLLLQQIADGVNNAYVNLVYTVTLEDSTVATYTIPAGTVWDQGTWSYPSSSIDMKALSLQKDTSYGIRCVMTDKNDATNQSVAPSTGTATAWVYVYKPTITFKDSVQDYKEDLNMGTNPGVDTFLKAHLVSVVWKHSTQTATPEGEIPKLTYAYTYASGAFDNFVMNSVRDVPVNVTVTIKGTCSEEITNNTNTGVTFAHQNCSHSGCSFNAANEEFVVHVINALTSLTINKTGWQSMDPNQSFLFTVTGKDGDGNPIDVTVTVHQNGSVTIDGLVIGNEYTITEDINWSWRYGFDSWSVSGATSTDNTKENGATITLVEKDNVIRFSNKRSEEKWLDGDSWCDNLFSTVAK